jgi:hypothetical protein
MMKTIWWDMDGTIADLYSVENWLPKLRAEDPTPYAEAKVLWNMSQLARLMNMVQRMGYRLGIISWTSRSCSDSYAKAIAKAKLDWLKEHLASVKFDEICIVSYGTPKSEFMDTDEDILFDDEEQNRDLWLGHAYEPDMMIKVLKALIGLKQ